MRDPFIYIDATGDCWEWTGSIDNVGYGRFWVDGKGEMAHRVVWETLVGPIAEDLELDHLCRNRLCVNPDHLEPVTRRVNILRGYAPSAKNARKTRCKNGHPFNEANTYYEGTWRRCRKCRHEAVRRHFATKEEVA